MDHKYLCLFFITCFAVKTISLKINELRVPQMLQDGSDDDIILDCDYDVGETTDGLVIKWFFDETQQVYQWIPKYRPQDLGILKGKLNLEYKASSDPRKMFRALNIKKVDHNLSGTYKCVVSTFMDEVNESKKMVVYVKEKEFNLGYEQVDEDSVRVTCSADAIFPQPNITIYDAEKSIFDDKYENITTREDGLFDIATSVIIDVENTEATFVCELMIPNTNYSVIKELVYSDSNKIYSFFTSCLLILPVLLLI